MPKNYRVAAIGRTGHGDYGHDLDQAWIGVPNTTLVSVADDDRPGLAKAQERLKLSSGYLDYREMLDKEKPEIVSICCRWLDKHLEMVLACAERGIHVYLEKPLCRTLAEADEMVAACERTHIKLAMAHPTRYSPVLAKVKQLIAEKKIGKVLEYRGRGKEDKRGGAEDLWVLGTHVMDMIRYLAGDPQWCFASVTVAGKPIGPGDVQEGPEGIGLLAGDQVQAMYRLKDGSTAYFGSTKSAEAKPSRYGLQIFGSRGVIEVLEGVITPASILADGSWSPGRGTGKWLPITSAGIDAPEPITDEGQRSRHRIAIEDLIACIESPERQPLSSVYEARAATEMIVAVFESQRLGKPVELPLATRENPLALLAKQT